MKKQRGQSLVEFALVIPMFALFLFGLIYGGIMFLQYFNISQISRAEARRVAVMDTTALNNYFNVGTAEGQQASYPINETNAVAVPFAEDIEKKLGSFYTVTPKIWFTTKQVDTDEKDAANNPIKKTVLDDVIIKVILKRENGDLPLILSIFNWPPEEIRAMDYRMKLENEVDVK